MAVEHEPCERFAEHDKRRESAMKRKAQSMKAQKAGGVYMNMNLDEIEKQLKMTRDDSQHGDDFKYLNKMHPADANFRDKRLGKILDTYNDEVGRKD